MKAKLAILTLTAALASLAASARAARAQAASRSACGTENLLAGKTPVGADFDGKLSLVTDGTVGEEGTVWNAPIAVISSSERGSLTFDLGAPKTVAALYLQGDANDTLQVTGSADGAAGSFTPIVEVPNVVDRGHGLRGRTLQFAPVTVRYLRVGEGRGDGLFSLSEVAAYCTAPAPFPPQLTVVADAAQVPTLRDDHAEPTIWLLVLAAPLALFGLVERMRKKGAAPAPGEEAARVSTHDALRLMFLASGCAALIYEVVWLHLLRLVIGASALSVGLVLASFMGGMFLGSLLFARLVSRAREPLRVYAMLEIGIGLFGLLMPLVLPVVRSLYVGLVGYGSLGIALRAVIAAVLLLPPTALMGATLPAVARRYGHGRRSTSAIASLYAANTVGAVLGSLLAAFYLLAVWDVWVATFTAAALNFLIGWRAMRLGRSAPPEPEEALATTSSAGRPAAFVGAVYLAAGLSGLTALGAQVAWTRLLALMFGATVYAFAIILAVFLAGLGIGSLWASSRLRRGQDAALGLAWSQLALVPTLLVGAWLLAEALPYAQPPHATPVRALHALHVVRAAIVILPSAILWGMSFPFALAAADLSDVDPARSSGRVYAANTVGCIIGSLAVSFVVIPTWGTRWAQQALVMAAAVSAAALLLAIRRASPAVAERRGWRWVSPAWALAGGAVATAILPGVSHVFQSHGRAIWWMDPRDRFPFFAEGAASTVAVHVAPSGFRSFHVSGRVEASSNPNDMRLQRLLGHLSALAHPEPRSVLVVGLGAGVTAGSFVLHPEVKRIVICEIEPRVTGAARQFAQENHDVLSDPRVEMVFDDARHFLATTREKFDVITSDPIHPWVRGNSILFSREYYEIVRQRLAPNGLATQWVPLYDTSEEAIRIQMGTFADAFPSGSVWNSHAANKGYDVVLLGRATPQPLDLRAIQARMDRGPRIGEALRAVKIASATDLAATYATNVEDMRQWLANAPINRDFSLRLEYVSGLALNQSDADPIYKHMIAGRRYPQSLFVAPPETHAELRRRLLDEGAPR